MAPIGIIRDSPFAVAIRVAFVFDVWNGNDVSMVQFCHAGQLTLCLARFQSGLIWLCFL